MKGSFSTDELKVSTSDGRNFKLIEPFFFIRPSGEVITVPAGTESDGASTPRAVWPTIPPFGCYWMAAYLHDWAYLVSDLPKEECDQLLEEGMEALDVPEAERIVIYEGVHFGGAQAFREDRQNQANQS